MEFLHLWVDARDWNIEQQRKDITKRQRIVTKRLRESAKTPTGRLMKEVGQMVKLAQARNPKILDPGWLERNREEFQKLGVFDMVELEIDAVKLELQHKRKLESSSAADGARAGISRLVELVSKRDVDAAERLFELCLDATGLLQMYYKISPELFRGKAKFYAQMPVLASLNPIWKELAVEHMNLLGLGAELPESRFKPTAYKGEIHVCREWAREAVKCIHRNRIVPYLLTQICAYLRDTERFTEVMPSKTPKWLMEACLLKPFCKAEAKKWGSVARRVIRSECPNFHENAALALLVPGIKRRSALSDAITGKRIGTIQNAILDKIVEAIETIATDPPNYPEMLEKRC